MKAGKAGSVCAVAGGPWAVCEPLHLSQVSITAAALALAAPWRGWFGLTYPTVFMEFGKGKGPNV